MLPSLTLMASDDTTVEFVGLKNGHQIFLDLILLAYHVWKKFKQLLYKY
jgi:hypothetical protein